MKPPPSAILVEGPSDLAAVETLARRLGRELRREGIHVIPMGGALSLADYLADLVGRHGPDIRCAGLCDEREEGAFARGLARAGFASNPSRSQMESLGFFVCVADLEDEMIRALWVDTVLAVMEQAGDLRRFHVFQNQPEWRGRDLVPQLRRFLGIKSGRKVRYGRLLVEALDLSQVPRPLEQVLSHVAEG